MKAFFSGVMVGLPLVAPIIWADANKQRREMDWRASIEQRLTDLEAR